jgi:hypothetical protein
VFTSVIIFELLARKDQTLLIRWDAFLVLDFGLDIFNRVRRLDIESDGLAGESFDKDLHACPSLLLCPSVRSLFAGPCLLLIE